MSGFALMLTPVQVFMGGHIFRGMEFRLPPVVIPEVTAHIQACFSRPGIAHILPFLRYDIIV